MQELFKNDLYVVWEGRVMLLLFVSCWLLRFTIISPQFRQNIALEHLEKGDNHNSALPWRVVLVCCE